MIQNLHILSLGRNLALGMATNDSALLCVHSAKNSFVVSNVGEFSRTILGSHFKHNNVSLIRLNFFKSTITDYHQVFELCSSAEHVWISQDKSGVFISL
jgi:hypothetical protein